MAQEFSESELLNPDENVDVSINDLYEQASELSEDIQEQDRQDLQEFQERAEKLYSKMEQTVKSLREAADKLDQVCRDCKMAHAVGTAGGVVSGLITLGATVMTGGAASPLLLAAGMGFGLGGAAINLGSSRIETAANFIEVKKAQKHLKETSDCINEVNAIIKDWLNTKEKVRLVYICFLAEELKFGPFVMKFLGQVKSFCSKTISTLMVKTAEMVVTLRRAFKLEGCKATVKFAEKPVHAWTQAADDIPQPAGAAGQAGEKVGENVSKEVLVVVSVAFLMFDAIDLGYTIRDIWENKGSEAVKHLREKAKKLEATVKQ